MQKLKISLLTLISSFSLSLPFVSANNSYSVTNNSQLTLYTPEENYQFIHDRSFDIGAFYPVGGTQYTGTVGTGWIFQHIKNYEYYMFTNWHVKYGMDEIYTEHPKNAITCFSFSINTSPDSRTGNLNQIPSLTWYPAHYLNYNNKQWGIDAAIAKINFTNNPANKSTLDNLNAYADQHNNMLVDFNTNCLNTADPIYIGGYPAADWSKSEASKYIKWQCATDTINEIKHFFKTSNPTPDNFDHGIDGSQYTDSKIISMSDTYNLNWYPSGTGPLFNIGGGASGSMILDSNQKVCGLYWGGFATTDGSKYMPSIEIFANGSNYDLLEDFNNNKWINDDPTPSPTPTNNTLIIAVCCSIGGVLLIGGITLLVIYFIRKKKNSTQQH